MGPVLYFAMFYAGEKPLRRERIKPGNEKIIFKSSKKNI